MICFPLDNTDYEARDMGAYLATRTRGVFSAEDDLAVAPATGGLSVTVSPGLAWLKWSDYWGTAALQEQALTLSLDTADGALSRIDAIVCRLDKVANRAEITVKKGSFSSTPVLADPVRDANYDELYLATVRVGPGAISLTAADITDQRLNEKYCGLMRDGVTGIPTAALQEQASLLIDQLQGLLEGVTDRSALMLKTIYDPDGKQKPYIPADEAMSTAVYGGSAAGVVAKADHAAQADHAAAADSAASATNAASAANATNAAKINNHALNMSVSGSTLYITW